MILYKYRNTSDYTDQIFTKREIWLSNAVGLNDPFECSIQEIAKEWIDVKAKEGIQGHLTGFIMMLQNSIRKNRNFYDLEPKQTKQFLKKFSAKKNIDEQYETFREFTKRKVGHYPTDTRDVFKNFDEQLNKVGIFSLSETATNQIMWAHYGQESKGIAIGFNVPNDVLKLSNSNFVKVNYSDVLPSFNGIGFQNESLGMLDEKGRLYFKQRIAFSDSTFRLAVSTKSTYWEPEREWRYIQEESGAYPYPAEISEIVFGLRCSKENKVKYKVLAETLESDISFSEIIKFPNTNEIKKVECNF